MMKKFLIACALFGASVQFSQAANIAAAGNAEAGEAKAVTCGACHGADGNSVVPTFPKLAGQGARYLLKQMMDIRDGARPVATMAGQVDNMSDEDLADIAAFYSDQVASGGQTDPDLLALGEKVYRNGIMERSVAACSSCHSPNGLGNGPAGFPALAGQHADYTAAQLRMYRKGYEQPGGRDNDGGSKIMRTTAFALSDLEIQAVSSYVAGLK
ncbi:MAG: cytochrome c553 [Halieaceae bacterium]|jgi:cytochrome c553